MKELILKKEVLTRLQDEEMEKLMGGEDISNTTANKGTDAIDNDEDSDNRSCCQKSCK